MNVYTLFASDAAAMVMKRVLVLLPSRWRKRLLCLSRIQFLKTSVLG
ncbi:hypothetical protein LINPERHAP2_LOCUS40159 [Linum perenne]